MLTSCTEEIDDTEAAVAEILSQLDLEHSLLKNAVGIVSCHCEFLEDGVVRKLCERLPFDVVGCTTLASATCAGYGLELLAVSVLTSDDVNFSTVVSEPISYENMDSAMFDAYRYAYTALPDPPAMVLAYPPLLSGIGSGPVSERLMKLCGAVPLFGTFSCENTMRFSRNRVIWNGESFPDALVLLMMSGDVCPRFFSTSIPQDAVQMQRAVITESDGCVVKRINDVLLADYLASKGLGDNSVSGIQVSALPFTIDYDDWPNPVSCALYEVMPQGYGVFGSEMPIGATLTIGCLNYGVVISTARLTAGELLQTENSGGFLMHSCIARNVMLGTMANDEMKSVQDVLGDTVSYQLSYSGGELCPVENANGVYVNRFHNFAFVACSF
jgi:hypothetical protein